MTLWEVRPLFLSYKGRFFQRLCIFRNSLYLTMHSNLILSATTHSRNHRLRWEYSLTGKHKGSAPSSPQQTGTQSSSPQKETHSQLREDIPPFSVVSDLELLIHIASAANCSRQRWRSQHDETHRITSSAKTRNGMLRPPNPTPCVLWLRLQILLKKVSHKICENTQPLQSNSWLGQIWRYYSSASQTLATFSYNFILCTYMLL